jgi:hypothetical protein
MAQPAVRVELGLDLLNDPDAAILDDPVKGILNSPIYTLGGVAFYDISDRVRSVQVRRGKSQALDRIDAGAVTIIADNNDRLFDPLFEASPFYGALVPRRRVRVYANDKFVIDAYIDDFNLSYETNGTSICQIDSSDAFSVLTKAILDEQTPTSQLSGARIESILNRPEVNWSATERDIDTGVFTMLDTTIAQDTQTLEYLQLVANSEFANLFIAKDGKIVFRDRSYEPPEPTFIISDSTDETLPVIPFEQINIIYGSEFLFNRIVISNSDTIPEEAIAESTNSQLFYGVLTYSATDLLTETLTDLESLAQSLLFKYQQPAYRFDSVSTTLDTLDTTAQNQLLDLELGDYVQIRFEPNGIAPAIVQYCKVIGIGHEWAIETKNITLSLEKIEGNEWQLDDFVFGRLSADNYLG